MKQVIYFLFFGLITIMVINACKKETVRNEPEAPKNPYEGIDYGTNPDLIPIDSASFLGLHTYILSTTCAVSGCHDGAFEPDFRTVQSSYNTLVYHPVVKNDSKETFTYRVVPSDTTLSWLHERITTDDPVLGRMPLYDQLTVAEIKAIETWIINGAKDVFGNSPLLPNAQPSTLGLIAYKGDTTGIRLDTTRENIVSAMKFPQDTIVQIVFGLQDTDEKGKYQLPIGLTDNTLKISANPFDFSTASALSLEVRNPLAQPFMGPYFLDNTNQKVPYYHSYSINTNDYPVGQTQYMRIYVRDADHNFSTEIPEDGSQLYFLTLFSFVIE